MVEILGVEEADSWFVGQARPEADASDEDFDTAVRTEVAPYLGLLGRRGPGCLRATLLLFVIVAEDSSYSDNLIDIAVFVHDFIDGIFKMH